MYYDEFVRLWCEECCAKTGCDLDIWNEINPIPVEDIIETIQEHEEEYHNG